jgi:predicted dehydrogenase
MGMGSLGLGWRRAAYLAAEGAEAEGVEEAALADLAGVGDALAGPRLRALVQEHHARAVDDVGLHAGDIQHLLNLRHPDHVVVGGPPYLHHQQQPNRACIAVSEKPQMDQPHLLPLQLFQKVSYSHLWIFSP